MRLPSLAPRRGISLLESLIAAAIMFMSFAALYSLIDQAQRQAQDVRDQSLAMQIAQSKLNELRAGSLPMSGQGGDFGDNDNMRGWEWSVTADQFQVQGLWRVRVEVKQTGKDSAISGAYLEQIVLDPSMRGSALDQATVTSSSSSSSGTDSSGSSSSSSSGSSGAGAGSSGKTQTPSGGGAGGGGGGGGGSGGGMSSGSGGKPSGGGGGMSSGSGGKPAGGGATGGR